MPRRLHPLLLVLLTCLVLADDAPAAQATPSASHELLIHLPEAIKARTARATAHQLRLDTPGTIDGNTIRFRQLRPDTPYDIRIELTDGRILQGVDMSWHSPEPQGPDVGEITDDDRAQIQRIADDVPAFYDRSEILLLHGNARQATALVQLTRDSGFYGARDGELIWRIELWYFQNRHGAWQRERQQNRVLRRERFPSRKAFNDEVLPIQWMPELEGIVLDRAQPTVTIELDVQPSRE